MKKIFSNYSVKQLSGDFFGGLASMLVALPSAIAFGLIIYSLLGKEYIPKAAFAGMLGIIIIAVIAPIVGGTSKLISAPCAPAAALLSVFVTELVKNSSMSIPINTIPLMIALAAFFAGLFQLLFGLFGGGKIIKYIPYPVVTGYLSAVGVLIFVGQVPKFIGLSKDVSLFQGLINPNSWRWESIVVGTVVIISMLASKYITKAIPSSIIAVIMGIVSYLFISLFDPGLRSVLDNPLLIGPITTGDISYLEIIQHHFTSFADFKISFLPFILVPAISLGVLLSIDTLKTCLILDSLTQSRHKSNKELVGQGVANIGSALLGGIPGAGTMGPTLVNVSSGAQTRISGIFAGGFSILVLLLLGKYLAWVPISALAGILLVIGVRMIDKDSLNLLKHRSTILDFIIIILVIISAVSLNLVAAAGVGIISAIILFLRDQIKRPIIRRKFYGGEIFSKKIRLEREKEVLQNHKSKIVVLELQGDLFFGTADKFYTEIAVELSTAKYIILDMKKVNSLDYTAAHVLEQIKNRIAKNNGRLIFTSLPANLPSGQNLMEYLSRLGLSSSDKHIRYFRNSDRALEWSEDKILEESKIQGVADNKILNLNEIELFQDFPDDLLKKLHQCVKEENFKNKSKIFIKGDPGDKIYFIRKGSVKIILPLGNGLSHHLATFPKRSFLGDMSFIDNKVRSADAVASGEVHLYSISRKDFDQVAKKHPAISGRIFEKLAQTLSNRLRFADLEITVLQQL